LFFHNIRLEISVSTCKYWWHITNVIILFTFLSQPQEVRILMLWETWVGNITCGGRNRVLLSSVVNVGIYTCHCLVITVWLIGHLYSTGNHLKKCKYVICWWVKDCYSSQNRELLSLMVLFTLDFSVVCMNVGNLVL
jgi:hypothetical protein